MGTPEVKVRLSAEGVQEVVAAFRRIQAESASAGSKSAQAFKVANQGLAQFRSLLATVGVAALASKLVQAGRAVLDFTDDLDDTAHQLGVTTDFLQELRFAATAAGTPIESLAQAMSFLEQKIDDAAQNGVPLIKFLDGTSISAVDATGATRGLQDVFAEIVRVFPGVAQGADQAGFAADLFGKKVGTRMVPLLGIGIDRLAALREEAHATGNVLESEFVKRGGAVNDELELLATRLTVAFASGLLDFDTTSINDLHSVFTDPKLTEGVTAFGKSIGDTIRFVSEHERAIELLASIAGGAALGGRFGKGGGIIGGLVGGVADLAFRTRAAGFDFQPTGEFVGPIQPQSAAPSPAPQGKTSVVDPAAAAKAEAAEKAAQAAREKARRAAERDANALQSAREAAAAFEAKLADLSGDRHDGDIRALELELAKYKENLETEAALDSEHALSREQIEKRISDARTLGTQRADFAELQRQSTAVFDDLAARRAAVENDVARGIKTQYQGEAEIAAIDKERLADLVVIADALERSAVTPEEIAAARQLRTEVGRVAVEADRAGREWAAFSAEFSDRAEGSLATFFTDIISGSKSAGDAFRDFTKSILASFEQMIAQLIAKKLFEAALGSLIPVGNPFGKAAPPGGFATARGAGGVPSLADGGFVSGPGTATSDSIPALLSDGEFVVRSKAVAAPGVRDMLYRLNDDPEEALKSWGYKLPPIRVPRYGGGGIVGLRQSPAVTAAASGSGTTNGTIDVHFAENMLHDRVVDILDRHIVSSYYKGRR